MKFRTTCGRALRAALSALVAATLMPVLLLTGSASTSLLETKIDGETSRESKEIYPGVTSTHFTLGSGSRFGQQDFTVVEFDPAQPDLYFDVLPGGSYANNLKKVTAQAAAFDERADRSVICAVNGDLWMTEAHSRNNGSSYKGYTDPVTTKTYTVTRGFNMYDGEIWSSAQIKEETPYEGDFYAFGITDDGVAVLGRPLVGIEIEAPSKTVKADGLNRLPANDALIIYSDKAASKNYALDDAYEVIVDCDPYTVRHGEVIKGKVTSITQPGGERAAFAESRLVLTARGSKVKLLEGIAAGDEITVRITVTDALGNDSIWQRMRNAVGGHIPVIIDGKSTGNSNSTNYPMTVLGLTNTGKVIMLCNDGRQSGYSVGIKIGDLDDICRTLGIATAFILDGGGSATMVQKEDSGFRIVNRPSDGSERSVVNTVVLSAGPEKSLAGEFYGKAEYGFDSESELSLITDKVRAEVSLRDGALYIGNTGERNQHVFFGVSGLSTDDYKYIVVRYRPDWTREEKYNLGLYFAVGAVYKPSDDFLRVLDYSAGEPDAEGYVTQTVDLSKASKWTGSIHGIELNVNEYTDRGNIGEGTLIDHIGFYRTAEEAEAAAAALIRQEETTGAPVSSEETSTDAGAGPAGGCRSFSACAALAVLPAAAACAAASELGKRKRRIG
ncbi:MAG: phosphodiester glycosidase family protein [Clostridia bacterium]|nr:phosphodiester glycosidase family protein [Clostridia bacterium]